MSSISNNLNQIMKTLTIITVIALPLTIITSFFGMNFEIPLFAWLLRHPIGFWASMALILGGVTMPLCCWLMAASKRFQSLFAVPVLSLISGAILTILEMAL